MRIPKKVKIGGIVYSVVIEKGVQEKEGADGVYEPNTNTIRIEAELSQQAKEITFIHECMHAMNSTMNHEFLDSLAEQLYQVLSDNKLLK